jgi:hypothetical protein
MICDRDTSSKIKVTDVLYLSGGVKNSSSGSVASFYTFIWISWADTMSTPQMI